MKKILCLMATVIAVMALFGFDGRVLVAIYWTLIAGYWMVQIADEDEG